MVPPPPEVRQITFDVVNMPELETRTGSVGGSTDEQAEKWFIQDIFKEAPMALSKLEVQAAECS